MHACFKTHNNCLNQILLSPFYRLENWVLEISYCMVRITQLGEISWVPHRSLSTAKAVKVMTSVVQIFPGRQEESRHGGKIKILQEWGAHGKDWPICSSEIHLQGEETKAGPPSPTTLLDEYVPGTCHGHQTFHCTLESVPAGSLALNLAGHLLKRQLFLSYLFIPLQCPTPALMPA